MGIIRWQPSGPSDRWLCYVNAKEVAACTSQYSASTVYHAYHVIFCQQKCGRFHRSCSAVLIMDTHVPSVILLAQLWNPSRNPCWSNHEHGNWNVSQYNLFDLFLSVGNSRREAKQVRKNLPFACTTSSCCTLDSLRSKFRYIRTENSGFVLQ